MPEEKAGVNMTAESITKLVERAIAAAREPIVDAKAEAAKEAERAQVRASIHKMAEAKRRKQAACTHRRSDLTACIAWATQCDRVTRGVCQRCGRVITPDDADYLQLTQIPHSGIVGEACLAGR